MHACCACSLEAVRRRLGSCGRFAYRSLRSAYLTLMMRCSVCMLLLSHVHLAETCLWTRPILGSQSEMHARHSEMSPTLVFRRRSCAYVSNITRTYVRDKRAGRTSEWVKTCARRVFHLLLLIIQQYLVTMPSKTEGRVSLAL